LDEWPRGFKDLASAARAKASAFSTDIRTEICLCKGAPASIPGSATECDRAVIGSSALQPELTPLWMNVEASGL